jgi:hypothetical protein
MADAADKLGETVASVPATASWQLETTERNLRLIRELRLGRGEDSSWIAELEQALAQKRLDLNPP